MFQNILVNGNYYTGYRKYWVRAREVKDTSSELEHTGLYEDSDGRFILQFCQDNYSYSNSESKEEALQELYDYIDNFYAEYPDEEN